MFDSYHSSSIPSSTPAPVAAAACDGVEPPACELAALRQALVETQRALRQAEQQLADQQAFYQAVLDHLKVDVAVFDTEHRFQAVNTQAFANPVVRKWVIGKTNAEYCAYRQLPTELGATRRRLLDQVMQSGKEVEWEETLVTATGVRQLLRHYVPVTDASGAVRMVVGTGTDVTERRRAEQQVDEQRTFYDFILNHIPSDIGVFDAEGRYLFVNASGIKDPAKRAWVLGKTNFEYCAKFGYPPELAEERQRRLDEAFARREMVEFEEVFHGPNGTTHQLRCLQPVFHDDGSPRLVVAYGFNITERVTTEKALRHAKLAAESAVRAREIFLANMSHEIRTPMNAILGMSQLLAKTSLAPDQDSYRQAISTSAEHLLVIINDILDLSKLEAGKMALENMGFVPVHLLAEIEQTLHYKAVEKGLSLVTRVAPTVPRVLIGDPYRIRQVLLNLAGNAIKFTETGRVLITCDFVADEEGSGVAIFRVEDTGIGIEPEFVQHIFNEFSQEDTSVTRKFGGTGLGLSISRNLLKLMGSDMQLESEKNKGTTMQFALRLPVGAAHHIAPREVLPPDSPVRSSLRNKQVLLVEDNRFNRQIAKTFLSQAHVQVTEAEHGAEAVELAQHQCFDLILMDIQMPVMDGYAATALLRQQLGIRTPIVALTANAINGEREKCLAAGMNGYLTKPFKEDQLLKTVGEYARTPTEADCPETARPAAAVSEGAPEFVPLPPPAPAADAVARLYKVDELLKVGQGDPDFVAFMLETFVESCEEAAQALHLGMQTADIALLKTAAHTLRPSLSHLHALQIMPPVVALDEWDGPFEADTLQPLVNSIRLLLREVVTQIRLDTLA